MHPASYILERGPDGKPIDMEFDMSPKNVTKAVAFLGVPAAALIGGLYAFGEYQDAKLIERSETVTAVQSTMTASMVAHAQGIESGLIINGVVVPAEVSDRISDLATSSFVAQVENMADLGDGVSLRHMGMEDALEGNWTPERLSTYVDQIAEFEPGIRSEIQTAVSEAGGLSIDSDRLDILVKLHVVSTLLNTDDAISRSVEDWKKSNNEDESSFAMVMERMRSNIASRLSDVSVVGGINRAVMTEIAVEAMLQSPNAAQQENSAEMEL